MVLRHTMGMLPLGLGKAGATAIEAAAHHAMYFFSDDKGGAPPHRLATHNSVESPRLPGAGG
jgi:hypothetical protein